MQIPKIRGLIDRRVLVNFRVAPEVLARVCPEPFRPQLVNGFGIAGICLIRLKQIRPRLFPSFFGVSSENAAHRIADEWDSNGTICTGVYIPRRDTSSLLNAYAGGRIFPGVHHRAKFDVRESKREFSIEMTSLDRSARVAIAGHRTEAFPSSSVFDTFTECSKFFENGSVGYSPAGSRWRYDGLELRVNNWQVQPVAVSQVASSFFDDRKVFPAGSVVFDNALLMQGIEHEWHSRNSLGCPG